MKKTKNVPIINNLGELRGYDVEGPLASVYATEWCSSSCEKPPNEIRAKERVQQKVFDDKSLEDEDMVMLAKDSGWTIQNERFIYKIECDVYRKIPKKLSAEEQKERTLNDDACKKSPSEEHELKFPIKVYLDK